MSFFLFIVLYTGSATLFYHMLNSIHVYFNLLSSIPFITAAEHVYHAIDGKTG